MNNITKIGVIAGISGSAITEVLQKKGISVVLVIGSSGESGADIADDTIVSDLSNKKYIAEELKKFNVTYVIMGTGHILAIELAGYLESMKMIISIDYNASLLAKDKISYKKALQKIGLSTPKFLEYEKYNVEITDEVIKEIGFPVVVKSAIDKILPQKCNSRQALEQAIKEVFATDSHLLIEEFIDGIDCTIPYVSNFDSVMPVLFSYYNKASSCHLKGFESNNGNKLTQEKEMLIQEYCMKAVKDIGIIGLSRIDAIIKDDCIYILECNSIIVTGVHSNQIDYGIYFLQKEGVNLAEILVNNALVIFEQKNLN